LYALARTLPEVGLMKFDPFEKKKKKKENIIELSRREIHLARSIILASKLRRGSGALEAGILLYESVMEARLINRYEIAIIDLSFGSACLGV